MKPLTQAFFNQQTTNVAKDLIGKVLIHETPIGPVGGIINETEAYTQEDPACHAYLGKKTNRNTPMFAEPGTIYIYFIYGMYYCLNIVTEEKNRGCAVLIRSIIPTIGLSTIKQNRPKAVTKNLSNGPSKLMQALAIPASYNQEQLINHPKLFIYDNHQSLTISQTPRIGIKKGVDLLWRYVGN
ncbi:3-methyladenine DNA glycosylase [Candidatus Marinamargulisbacteria bacterium SCGC AG-414-C22]|nr:3-methyladenine DNA glycosylase [Candidatus Marinamargulisbacteria bacterium SCGC AG-414-C22]